MPELTLLLGNGINRLGNSHGPSWGQLLESIQDKIGMRIDLDNDFKPFPMAFEEMLLTNCKDYENRLKDFKRSISEAFLAAKPNIYHTQIVQSNYVKNILTTNYDYSFERVLLPEFSNIRESETSFLTKEIKHNLRRRNLINNKSIWHIHGEIYDPKNYHKDKRHFKEESILIGYEHYSESLKVMQDYKNGRNKWARTPLKTKLSQDIDLGTSWIDFLLTTEMLIIGLDLSFSEIDLWYILNYRARLLSEYQSKSSMPATLKKSKITFVMPKITKKNVIEMSKKNKKEEEKINRNLDKMKARADVLKAFAVDTEEILSLNYEDFYQKFINSYLK